MTNRKLARLAGILFIATFVTSIPAKLLYDSVLSDPHFIVGAGSLKYRDIVDVIDAAKGAGVEKVGIVTEGMRRAGGASD